MKDFLLYLAIVTHLNRKHLIFATTHVKQEMPSRYTCLLIVSLVPLQFSSFSNFASVILQNLFELPVAGASYF